MHLPRRLATEPWAAPVPRLSKLPALAHPALVLAGWALWPPSPGQGKLPNLATASLSL